MIASVHLWQHLCTMRTRVLFTFLVAMGVLVGKGCSNSPMRCIESERQALLSFKQSFVVKDVDLALSSWTSNSSQDCCSWDGISCDNKTNHVIRLVLVGHQLRSEISPSLLQLKYLEHLDLRDNNLSKIPEFIGSLTRLTHLDLSGNPISGTIPSQLGNLTSLRSLSLGGTIDHNSTVSNFRWISRLSSLKYLQLVNFNFTTTSTSDWLQSIKITPSLTRLDMEECQISEVDASSFSHINSSNTLKAIYMENNTIHPTAILWLLSLSSNLLDLIVNYNQIGGPLPNSFENMTSLASLDLSCNGFDGEIPKSLGTLCNLKSLDLSSNELCGTLDNLLESQVSCTNQDQLGGPVFPALEELYLHDNLLEGPLPNSLRQFPNLRLLTLGYNHLTGPLPDLSPFSSLEELRASNNKLNGSLPESIGQLQSLTFFDVSSNSFSGVVLSEAHLMNLSRLIDLDLSFSSLTLNLSSNWVPPFQLGSLNSASCTMGPQFPNWLRTQSQGLYALDISNSSIFGVIPSWFSNVSFNLFYLNMSFNHLNGMVPNLWPNSVVDLSSNQFQGAIPPVLSNASELYLSNNKFSEFKRFLCTPNDKPKVLVLDLSDNLLSGRMPDCWLQWRGLGVLNLENNNLSGIIPSSLGSLGLQTLCLRNNSLSGNLPSSLNGSSELLVLDVGHNSLNGKIPTWIGEIQSNKYQNGLKLLSLKSNEFYGSIPSNLCHLYSIQILDLSLNHLSGVIPSCINNFTAMAQVKLQTMETITTEIKREAYDGIGSTYENKASLMWKGLEYKYDKILGLLRLIDLSNNRLSGQIPETLANLVELVEVNLSRNHLSGIIPKKVGELNRLESLDLSHNQLSGEIPMGLAEISSLAYLDLSNNQLWGKIPTGTQLQSFSAPTYAGNLGLCGPPLTSTCPEDKTSSVPSNSSGDGGDWLDKSWFNIGIGVGFVVGFWGVCGTLALKTSWRHAYFRLLNKLGDRLYVTIMIQKARLKRRLQS